MDLKAEQQKIKYATGDFADNIALVIAEAKGRKVYTQDMIRLLACAIRDLSTGGLRNG